MAFRFSPPGRQLTEPWFHIGNYGVGSAGVMALIAAATMALGAFSDRLISFLALSPAGVRSGELWRIATWPFAIDVDLWAALGIIIFGLFGTMIEAEIGRRQMTFVLVSLTVLPALLATGLGVGLAGIRLIELVIIVLFIADNPRMPFFFGIPAWVFGVFIVVLDFLRIVDNGSIELVLIFVFMLVLGALLGRSVGMLKAYGFIPKVPLLGVLTGQRRVVTRKNKDAPTRNHRGRVVQGPWSPNDSAAAPTDRAADQAELDGLLDKINENGLDALSNKEKKRLNELSKRLR